MPLLICSTALSAVALSVNEAWKAVCKHHRQSVSISTKFLPLLVERGQVQVVDESFSEWLTGKSRLMTLKLSRHALICVTVLL